MTHNICFILLAVDKENNNDPLKIWGLYLSVLAFPGECVNQLGSEVKSIPERSAGWFKTLDVWHRLMLCDIKKNFFLLIWSLELIKPYHKLLHNSHVSSWRPHHPDFEIFDGSRLTQPLTPGFNGLGKDHCKRRQETFKFWDLVRLILEVLRYMVYRSDFTMATHLISPTNPHWLFTQCVVQVPISQMILTQNSNWNGCNNHLVQWCITHHQASTVDLYFIGPILITSPWQWVQFCFSPVVFPITVVIWT